MKRIMTITALLGAFALSGCGVTGELEKAPPLWGDTEKKTDDKKSDD